MSLEHPHQKPTSPVDTLATELTVLLQRLSEKSAFKFTEAAGSSPGILRKVKNGVGNLLGKDNGRESKEFLYGQIQTLLEEAFPRHTVVCSLAEKITKGGMLRIEVTHAGKERNELSFDLLDYTNRKTASLIQPHETVPEMQLQRSKAIISALFPGKTPAVYAPIEQLPLHDIVGLPSSSSEPRVSTVSEWTIDSEENPLGIGSSTDGKPDVRLSQSSSRSASPSLLQHS